MHECGSRYCQILRPVKQGIIGSQQSAVSLKVKSTIPSNASTRSPINSTSTRGPFIPKNLAYETSYFRKEEEVFVA
jgi:hypothetical protein